MGGLLSFFSCFSVRKASVEEIDLPRYCGLSQLATSLPATRGAISRRPSVFAMTLVASMGVQMLL